MRGFQLIALFLSLCLFHPLCSAQLERQFGSAAFFQSTGNECREPRDLKILAQWATTTLVETFNLTVPPVFHDTITQDKDVISHDGEERRSLWGGCSVDYCNLYPDMCILMGMFTHSSYLLSFAIADSFCFDSQQGVLVSQSMITEGTMIQGANLYLLASRQRANLHL